MNVRRMMGLAETDPGSADERCEGPLDDSPGGIEPRLVARSSIAGSSVARPATLAGPGMTLRRSGASA